MREEGPFVERPPFVLNRWQPRDYRAFVAYLRERAEPGYQAFNARIVNDPQCPLLGVRMPVLQACARAIARGDWQGFLALSRDDSHEEGMVAALVAGRASSLPWPEGVPAVEGYIPRVHNWSLCDSFCTACKGLAGQPAYTWSLCQRLVQGGSAPWEKRVGLVLAMTYLLWGDWAPLAVELAAAAPAGEYYVDMARAWLLCTAWPRFPALVEALLTEGRLDDFTHNKTLSKLRDSHLVAPEEKARLCALRRGKGAGR